MSNIQVGNWRIRLILNGIDVSDNLVNSLRIEAEEGTAKIAEFSLIPHMGPISVTKWIGKPVKIFYEVQGEQFPLFNGIVDEPIYDPTTKITTFSCTDQFQDEIQRLTQPEIASLVNGSWSSVVFKTSDNWNYLQDCLSTVPACVDLDIQNKFRLSNWEAKNEPDYLFREDEILYQSITVQLANRREIHNQTDINFQYRYQRFKQREILFDYRYPLSFCEQNYHNATLPNVDMINQAISGTGWDLKHTVEFVNQRGPGWVTCGDISFGFMIKDELQRFLVREARFTLAKRFVQTVTESYQLQVKAPQSINQLGEIGNHDSLCFEHLVDSSHFLSAEGYQKPSQNSVIDHEGNYVLELENRTALDKAIFVKLNQAKVGIIRVHRNNLVRFTTPIQPLIERHHTARLDAEYVKAQGKVKHIVHECDFSQGSCLTTITLAVSRTDDDTPMIDSAFSPPSKVTLLGDPGEATRVELPTYLGGKVVSPPFEESWEGYTGNLSVAPGGKVYPQRFVISTPTIDAAQAPIEHCATYQYPISIPNELLLLSA